VVEVAVDLEAHHHVPTATSVASTAAPITNGQGFLAGGRT
jgi:hypothetical protein